MKFLHSHILLALLAFCPPAWAEEANDGVIDGAIDTIEVIGADVLAEVDRHGICRQIHNNGPAPLMVPTQSPSEWSTGENAFLNNISGMPGVSVRQCLPKADASIASFHWGVLYTKDPDNPYLHHGMEEIFFDGHWSPYPIELYWQALGIPNDYLWQGITPSSPPRGYCRLKDGSPAVKIIDDSSNAFFLASRGDDWAEEGRGMARPEGTFWRARLKSWRDNYFDIAMEDVLTPDQGICTVIVTFDSAWTWNINNDFYKGPAKSVAGFTYYVAAPSGILPDERGVYFPPYVD